MRPRGSYDSALGNQPPIPIGGDPPDRSSVIIRWTIGTALLGAGAWILLGAALFGAFDQRARFVSAPTFVVPHYGRQAVAEWDRGDRDIRRIVAPGSSHPSAVRVEQLSNSGSMRPFTLVLARLAEVDPDPHPSGARALASDNAGHDGGGSAAIGGLPSIILYGTSHPSPPRSLPSRVSAYADDPSQPVGQPLNVTAVPKSPPSQDTRQRVVVARAGDTLRAILNGLAAGAEDVQGILAAYPRRHWFSEDKFSGGETITIIEEASSSGPAGHILKLTVESPEAGSFAIARTDAGRYQRVAAGQDRDSEGGAPAPDDLDQRGFSGETLRDSLHALARSNNVNESIVAEFMRLCSHDFDLDQPLGSTDAADLLYAPDDLGQPELFFVALTAQGRTRRYYRFTAPDDGSTDFYNGDGRSVTKFLLRKPVIDGRLGDGFGWRIHPILHDWRFHEGVDYAAPFGSPIVSAGAGAVELIGQQWGYGKYIRIRHDLGYETTYAHVSGFPRGLKIGDRVRQGETIAYVGSTGLSTGPHLYYEVRINGHNVDPLRVKLAAGRVLKGQTLAKFLQTKRSVDGLITAPAHMAEQ